MTAPLNFPAVPSSTNLLYADVLGEVEGDVRADITGNLKYTLGIFAVKDKN